MPGLQHLGSGHLRRSAGPVRCAGPIRRAFGRVLVSRDSHGLSGCEKRNAHSGASGTSATRARRPRRPLRRGDPLARPAGGQDDLRGRLRARDLGPQRGRRRRCRHALPRSIHPRPDHALGEDVTVVARPAAVREPSRVGRTLNECSGKWASRSRAAVGNHPLDPEALRCSARLIDLAPRQYNGRIALSSTLTNSPAFARRVCGNADARPFVVSPQIANVARPRGAICKFEVDYRHVSQHGSRDAAIPAGSAGFDDAE
jgi:hypothetical protein